eukprot:scaffold23822_cov143-Skeletonema_marinoi.AAC.6
MWLSQNAGTHGQMHVMCMSFAVMCLEHWNNLERFLEQVYRVPDSLDFTEIEKELAARLTDDDIKAVLWCIDAANKVKRLSLAHCVNITGSCLEQLRGSQIIEQIDLSLVGRHEDPVLIEPWHPPRKDESLVLPFVPPISCENVLPILDSIIVSEQCSLQHLQFPKAWRTNYPSEKDSNWSSWSRWNYDTSFKPDPTFVRFLMRYNQMLMNRGISCVKCSHNLHSSGYQLVGSSVSDRKSFYTFGNQNHTCSQCMKHYCYRCGIQDSNEEFRNRRDGIGDFHLERCNVCEREQCVECSGINRECNDCDLSRCESCKKELIVTITIIRTIIAGSRIVMTALRIRPAFARNARECSVLIIDVLLIA